MLSISLSCESSGVSEVKDCNAERESERKTAFWGFSFPQFQSLHRFIILQTEWKPLPRNETRSNPSKVQYLRDHKHIGTFLLRGYFSFQPVLHDWCNKGCGMCYPVCGMVHIKEPLLLIVKSSLCDGSGFPFSLSEWSLTICLKPYYRK